MYEVRAYLSPNDGRACRRGPLVLLALGLAAVVPAAAVAAAPAASPSVPPGFTITKLASAPAGVTNCDDLAFLEGHLYLGCQNATLSSGGGGMSTLVEYAPDGTLVKTWSIKDKIDGVGGDPIGRRVILTLNEDANSHLETVTPAGEVTNYDYAPDPHGTSSTGALHTGGGTDHVSVDSGGHIFVTGSHASNKSGTAVLKVSLAAPSSPTGTGTATLSPTFADNATAANGNTGTGTVKLSLGDVDSGTIVPQTSPRFGGSYVIGDQTALQLVFVSNLGAGTGLTALKTPFGLDDIKWTTSDGGTLYVVDKGAGSAGMSAVYKVTGPFTKDTVLASNDGLGDQVVSVDLATGKLTPLVRHLHTTKGLVYLDPAGTETALALAGSSSAAATATAPAKSSGSDNTLTIVLIVAALVLLGGGGYALARRRPRAG